MRVKEGKGAGVGHEQATMTGCLHEGGGKGRARGLGWLCYWAEKEEESFSKINPFQFLVFKSKPKFK